MTMPEHSKYYNLERPQKGWDQQEFVKAVLFLESLPNPTLAQLVEKLGIRFSKPNDPLEDEDYISVLFDDVEKDELLEALRKYE